MAKTTKTPASGVKIAKGMSPDTALADLRYYNRFGYPRGGYKKISATILNNLRDREVVTIRDLAKVSLADLPGYSEETRALQSAAKAAGIRLRPRPERFHVSVDHDTARMLREGGVNVEITLQKVLDEAMKGDIVQNVLRDVRKVRAEKLRDKAAELMQKANELEA